MFAPNMLFPDLIQTPSIGFPFGSVYERLFALPLILIVVSHAAGVPLPSALTLTVFEACITMMTAKTTPIPRVIISFSAVDMFDLIVFVKVSI